ncbi:unnamed protein product [Schistosoma curassoni]|uniref:Ovule protein n=1 Tax=Schistosoma curassoni TaxID=6186 RepID=A0A183K6P9_9TREM|nr:unnamed protein product [Schistosoma curassoni]
MVVGDQQLVHTSLVPSGYWSPGAPLVYNEGFPTSLGGLSISTNPVKASDTRSSSSQFRKQHPRIEMAEFESHRSTCEAAATTTSDNMEESIHPIESDQSVVSSPNSTEASDLPCSNVDLPLEFLETMKTSNDKCVVTESQTT